MFTFVHAADLHLGRHFSTIPDPDLRERLAAAHLDAWRSLVQLCIDRSASFLLIAGDVFENPRPDGKSIGTFLRHIGELSEAGIDVLAVPGNHDPASKGSPFLTGTLDEVISFTSPKPGVVPLTASDGTKVEVIGAGFRSSTFCDDPTPTFPKGDKDGTFRIGLLHSSLDNGGTRESTYAPCTRDGLASLGYQYWALGHIHKREVIEGTPLIAFPGCLCGGDVGETGRKGALVVNVANGVPSAEFMPLADAVWLNQVVDISSCDSDNDVRDRVEEAVGGEAEGAGIACARITLSGRVGSQDLARRLRSADGLRDLSERMQEELDLAMLELREGDIRVPLDIPRLREQPHLLGEVLRVIEEARADAGVLARYGLGLADIDLDEVEAIIAESFMEGADNAD